MNSSNELTGVTGTLQLPKHIAIIMDGNNRWARSRGLPGIAGHKAGKEAVRQVIKSALHYEISALTLYAFSTENWKRPKDEVRALMRLLVVVLKNEVSKLHERNIRLRIIGNTQELSLELQKLIATAEQITSNNDGLQLNVAINYGGRWDILTAAKNMASTVIKEGLPVDSISEADFSRHLCLSDLPEVDLCIRTSGEHRISNFLLWQLAYAEFLFIDTLWPDFQMKQMGDALTEFSGRQRNFGKSSAPKIASAGG